MLRVGMNPLSWALGFAITLIAVPAMAADTYKIDASHSTVMFRVKHLNTSYAYGRLNDLSGTFVLDAKDAAKASVDLTIKMESVDTANADRDKHLRGPDFFNVKQFPTSVFKTKSAKAGANGAIELIGEFTLHGVTKPMTVILEKTGEGPSPFKDYRAGLEGTLKIKRSDFEINYMPDGLGDEVTITVSLEGTRPQ